MWTSPAEHPRCTPSTANQRSGIDHSSAVDRWRIREVYVPRDQTRCCDQLRDPDTPAAQAEALAASTPAILLVQANVHGGEESGTESSLQLLYELADRNDCVSETILGNAIVVIVRVQNPDGREADTCRNAFDIDMNRDWFARTQPETDARLERYRQLPPVLDLDVHEMGRALRRGASVRNEAPGAAPGARGRDPFLQPAVTAGRGGRLR